jgi:curved DNA-binding protein CbpA
MNDPFAVLELPPDADEETIRRRYLELVRQSPPDRDPSRFAAIRQAYDEVRDPDRRLAKLLLEVSSTDSIDAIADDLRARLRARLDLLPIDDLLALAESR